MSMRRSQPLRKPLKDSTLALITTAAPYQPDKGDQGPGAAYNAAAKFYTVFSGDTAADHDTRICHIGYDRKHTTAKDSGTWFPLPLMRIRGCEGRFTLAKRFRSRLCSCCWPGSVAYCYGMGLGLRRRSGATTR